MNLSINHLQKIKASKKLESPIQELVDIFLAAINDWPQPIDGLNEYEQAIEKLLSDDEIDKVKLEHYLAEADYSKFAWEAESIAQLLEVFNYCEEGKCLREIIEKVEKLVNI